MEGNSSYPVNHNKPTPRIVLLHKKESIMYIKKLNYLNIGPIEYVDIDMPFNEDESPKPLIIVGKNGSGKSIFLSNIVDSMYEIGGQVYNNVLKKDSLRSLYYKISSFSEVKYGKAFSSVYICYEENGDYLEYFFQEGDFDLENWRKITNINCKNIKLDNKKIKVCTTGKDKCSNLFNNNVCCYFSPNRFSKPYWLSSVYDNECYDFNLERNFEGDILNHISVNTDYKANVEWILNVILDSKLDVNNNESGGYRIDNFADTNLCDKSYPIKRTIEKVLSEIIDNKVFIRCDNRNQGMNRIKLFDEKHNIVLHSLNALSTGQMALFNIFITILRYADRFNIDNLLDCESIKGVVVIDEIDLHLHNDLQYEVLPKLLKLFKSIQFVITTHSPLFILGMDKYYGKDMFQIREFPKDEIIQPEEFSEFINAYHLMENTKTYRDEIKSIKESIGTTPLIITEGPSDWIHIKHALIKLSKDDSLSIEEKELIKSINAIFLEYYNDKVDSTSHIILKMGCDALDNICRQFSKIPQNRKYIFIFDRDDKKILKAHTDESDSKPYKYWGNNVYSLCLPKINSRDFDELCIEHYYSEEDLKRYFLIKEDGIKRRLYLASEFDDNGESKSLNRRWKLDDLNKKIKHEKKQHCYILDGSKDKRICCLDLANLTEEEKKSGITKDTNLALSKIRFAEAVSNEVEEFKDIDVQNFLDLLKIIATICKKKNGEMNL